MINIKQKLWIAFESFLLNNYFENKNIKDRCDIYFFKELKWKLNHEVKLYN